MSRRPVRCRALVLAVILLTSGCGLFRGSDPTVERTRQTPEGPTLLLIDAGAEPRRPIRFELTEGTSVDLRHRVDLHLTQRTSDSESPQVLDPPVTHHTVRLTVDAVAPEGSDVSFEIIDAGIDPSDTVLTDAQIVELTSAVQAVVGLRGAMRVDPTGRVLDLRYDDVAGGPGSLDADLAELESSLMVLVPVLPSEPIGRGARWRTVHRSSVGGLQLRQVTDHEVTGIEDGRLTYRSTVTQTAPEQDVEAGDLGARILAADVVGTATGMVSTTDLSSESETSMRGTQVVELSAGADPARRMTQELDLLISVGPTSPSAAPPP